MLFRKIFGYDLVATTKLRIAKNTTLQDRRIKETVIDEDTGRRGETIVIFRRPQEIVIETRFRRECESGAELIIGIQFDGVVLCLVAGRELGVDHAQVRRLPVAQIRINVCDEAREVRDRIIRQRISIRHAIGGGRIERAHLATLTEIGAQATQKCAAIDGLLYQLAIDRQWDGRGGAKLLAAAQAVIVFGEMLPNQVSLKALAGLPTDGEAARP